MPSAPLPDPAWSDAAALCPACGYSLAGLAAPVHCPECGLMHSGKQFSVYGVPNARGVMPRWRLATMVVLVVVGFLLFQSMGVLLELGHGLTLLLLGGAWAAAVVVFIFTGPRATGGKCRLIFVEGGVNVTPLKIDETKAHDGRMGFVRFTGEERVHVKPVSSVWATLRITRGGADLFKAGVRCPRAQAPQLLSSIEELIRAQAPTHPPTLRPRSSADTLPQ